MRIVIADHNPTRGQQWRVAAQQAGLDCDSADLVGFELLAPRIAEAAPDLLLVICDDDGGHSIDAVRVAHRVTGVPVFAAGPAGNPAQVCEYLKAGACDYLNLDKLETELPAAVFRHEPELDRQGRRGTVIALYSPCGGAGVTSTAVHLAARLAVGTPGWVALAELKPAPGDLAPLLELEMKHSLDDLCREQRRVDRQLLRAALVEHDTGVHVLAQTSYSVDGRQPEPLLDRQQVRQIIEHLRLMFRITVLDLDHTLSDAQFEALRLANFIGLVVRPDAIALRRTRWAIEVAAARGLERERFRVIVTHVGQRRMLDHAEVERALGLPVFQTISQDQVLQGSQHPPSGSFFSLSKFSRMARGFSALARYIDLSARSNVA